jgi:hypothetical protein
VPYPTPTTPRGYAHYIALKAAEGYLKVEDLEDGYLYLMHGRNSFIGVWRAELQSFTIIREKLGRKRLEIEMHWDTGPLHGTAKPFVKLSGPVASDQRRQVLEAAHADISHDRFMAMTGPFVSQ